MDQRLTKSFPEKVCNAFHVGLYIYSRSWGPGHFSTGPLLPVLQLSGTGGPFRDAVVLVVEAARDAGRGVSGLHQLMLLHFWDVLLQAPLSPIFSHLLFLIYLSIPRQPPLLHLAQRPTPAPKSHDAQHGQNRQRLKQIPAGVVQKEDELDAGDRGQERGMAEGRGA